MAYSLRSGTKANSCTISQKLSAHKACRGKSLADGLADYKKDPSILKTQKIKKEVHEQPILTTVKQEKLVHSETVPVKKRKKLPSVKIEYEEYASALPQVAEGIWSPPYWREQLLNIRTMRSSFDAPVDSMGCEKISDKDAQPKDFRYQVMLSLMLSSMTKDEVTSAAMARLKAHGCSVERILKTSDDVLGKLIYPVGFWKSKVSYIKRTSALLKEKYDCDIPTTVEELVALPGIGPKMAHLIMQCAWNDTTGIAVDTHVFRITQRLGWIQKKPKQPEDCRKALESWLPKELWHEINWLLVGFGQQTCSAIRPKCDTCLNRSNCTFPSRKLKV